MIEHQLHALPNHLPPLPAPQTLRQLLQRPHSLYSSQFLNVVIEPKPGMNHTVRHHPPAKALRIPAMVNVEYFWSRSNPDGPDGRIGRIIAIRFGAPDGAERYVVNTESVFRWYDGDTDEDRLRALHEELDFFLEDTGFALPRDQG